MKESYKILVLLAACLAPTARVRRRLALCAMFLILTAAVSSVLADGTNAPPASPHPPAAAAPDANFGQYLMTNQTIWMPFLKDHADDLARSGLPLLLSFLGYVVLLNLLVGWIFDLGLSYLFSAFFAPAYAKIKQAITYATGRLILVVIVAVACGVGAIGLAAISPALIVLALILYIIITISVQIYWITMIYRTALLPSCLFYFGLVIIHSVLGVVVSGPIAKARAINVMTTYINLNVTEQLNKATAESKKDLATVNGALEKVKGETSETQGRLDKANADQVLLTKAITQKQNSEGIAFQRVIHVRAQGDLTAARDQFIAFLDKFPDGTLRGEAKDQLSEINSELAVKDVERKQAEIDAAIAAAKARDLLLARAEKGEVTLSEMRVFVIGKTRDEVKGLFGVPTEAGPNRWGYGRQMILNTVTDERHGLTVYFREGTVQSVDYYYGTGDTK